MTLNFILMNLNVELVAFGLIEIEVYFIQFSKIMILLITYFTCRKFASTLAQVYKSLFGSK